MRETGNRPGVVIIGAGFAGLWAARALAREAVSVTVIDRNNYHTFLPLLYQVGAAEIEPEQIAYPIRTLVRSRGNVRYLRGEIGSLDLADRSLTVHGQRLSFDYALIAAGSVTNFYGVPGAEAFAFTLKTLDDSMILRNHILTCFERASYCADEARKRSLLTFVIVGGGPTGIEFAGALAELVKGPLRKDFAAQPLGTVRVVLVEAADRVLGMLDERLSAYTRDTLGRRGVEVMVSTQVREISAAGVTLGDGRLLPSETVLWTAGVKGGALAEALAVPLGGGNRVRVLPTLQLPGHETVYAAGDIVYFEHGGAPLPQIAPVAVQQGRHAAENIARQIRGAAPREFSYRDKGAMVTIGRNSAVARIGTTNLDGFFAWLVWLVIHIMNLIGFRNKLLVIINWAWDYLFFERAVRLILPSCCDDPAAEGCRYRCGRG